VDGFLARRLLTEDQAGTLKKWLEEDKRKILACFDAHEKNEDELLLDLLDLLE